MALCITQDQSDLREQMPRLVLRTEPERFSGQELVQPGLLCQVSHLLIKADGAKEEKLWILNAQGFSPCNVYASMYIFYFVVK